MLHITMDGEIAERIKRMAIDKYNSEGNRMKIWKKDFCLQTFVRPLRAVGNVVLLKQAERRPKIKRFVDRYLDLLKKF